MAQGRIVAQLPLTVACALMAWQVWLLFHVAAAEGARVTWSCDVSSCGTDDLAGGAPMMGAAAVVALSLLSTRYLHRAAPGVAVALAGAASGAGWQDTLDAGDVTADESMEWPVGWFTPENWIIVAQVITVAGCLYALRGGWVSLRRTQGLHRLALGRRLAVAEAELTGWERAGRNRGRVVVGFHDGDGAHHAFPAVVDRYALGRTAFVLYDVEHPGDATSSRVSSPRKGKL
ncbi:hypothetical protein PUR28_14490 [Streptomyces sp. BE308]|uniref:hypothetical protein n=1 Tax=Streptomyces sp. BE308 TaxID=3002529 RepID=UPI002E7673AF|nr:hypothetical protein [Streptomyces sp. BE308]MEE1791967.1 hypothetical protein [Streptomyces sp. BE308]